MEVKYKQLVDFDEYFIKKPHGDAAVDLRVASMDRIVQETDVLLGVAPDIVSYEADGSDMFNVVPRFMYSIHTGMSVEIPVGFVGLLSLRSSFARAGFIMMNTPGIIDSGFRNEMLVTVMLMTPHSVTVPRWYRAAQLTVVPHNSINLMEVANLSDSERGMNGFGSTGGV